MGTTAGSTQGQTKTKKQKNAEYYAKSREKRLALHELSQYLRENT